MHPVGSRRTSDEVEAVLGEVKQIASPMTEPRWLSDELFRRVTLKFLKLLTARSEKTFSASGPSTYRSVVQQEFTNWRDEQRSWRETCALFDHRIHMTDLYVEGPDALKVFSDLAVNSFKNSRSNTAKQFVATSQRGSVHRRRDPVSPLREPLQPRRTSAGCQLGAVQPRNRQIQRQGRT